MRYFKAGVHLHAWILIVVHFAQPFSVSEVGVMMLKLRTCHHTPKAVINIIFFFNSALCTVSHKWGEPWTCNIVQDESIQDFIVILPVYALASKQVINVPFMKTSCHDIKTLLHHGGTTQWVNSSPIEADYNTAIDIILISITKTDNLTNKSQRTILN